MRYLLVVLLVTVSCGPVFAQDVPPDPFQTARIRFGPFAMNPTIAISNVGVDGNVFNEWDNPKKDFTATVTPGAELLFRAGRTRLTTKASLGYLFFKKYSQERSFNTDLAARYDVNLIHVRPYAIVSYLNTRERPGWEIDTRARRYEHMYTVGADVPVSPRVTFTGATWRQQQSYAADAQFFGAYLREVLNRHENGVRGGMRYKATPLTTFTLGVENTWTRFAYTPARDSNAFSILPGVEFDAFAIIQGSAQVGFKKLDMVNADIPGYSGPVAKVTLGHTIAGTTRFAVEVGRDVYYSFDSRNPYYVQTGASLTVTQRVRGPFDLQARGGTQRLHYVEVPGQAETSGLVGAGQAQTSGFVDSVGFYGGGVGYRVGRTARLGLNVDSYHRSSHFYQRDYTAVRVGTSLTYGF